MGTARVSRLTAYVVSFSLLLSSCGWGDGGENVSYLESFSDVEWDWEGSNSEKGGRIIPVARGVAVVRDHKVTVLSGETGREAWSYGDEENAVERVMLSGNGDYLVWKMVLEPWKDGEEEAEYWLADPTTGEIIHKLPASGYVGSRLFTDLLYVQEEKVGNGETTRFAAYRLADGEDAEPVWASEAHLRCEMKPGFEIRNHDVVLVEDVAVMPYTCVEDETGWQNEGRQDIVSGMLALDVENGEELWRTENVLDDASLRESSGRELERVNDDYLMVYGRRGRTGVLLDAHTGELIPDMGVVFAGPENASWIVGDEGDDEYVRLGEDLSEEAKVDFSFESDLSGVVPLEGGLAAVTDVETDPTAIFQPWEEESERVHVDLGIPGHEVLDVQSVPGAVVVLHRDAETGHLGVLGLT